MTNLLTSENLKTTGALKMPKSVVTEYENISVFSGKPREAVHHLVFGVGKKELADEYGLWIPTTHAEHNMSSSGTILQIHGNPMAEKLSKIAGQLAFEKEYYRKKCGAEGEPAREEFRKVFG